MNAKTLSQALLPIAALTLCGSLAFAQDAPAPPAPPAPDSSTTPQKPPAPVERHVPRAPRPARPAMDHPPMGPMMREHGMHEGFMGGPMGFGMERRWWKDSNVAQQLNLTPDQVRKMDSIFEQSKLQLIDLRASVEKQEVLLEPLLSANPVDSAKATAQIEKVAHARADLEIASAKMLLGIRGVLTPDQWTKLNDRRSWHRGFDGGAGAPPAPPAPPAGPAGASSRRGGQPGSMAAPLPDGL